MYTPQELDEFRKHYESYAVEVLKPTEKRLVNLFEEWTTTNLWGSFRPDPLPIPSPIHSTCTRIKRPESVVDKILIQPQTFPAGLSAESLENVMNDTVGGRIIVYFLSDLPLLHQRIIEEKKLEISRRNPPVAFLSEEVMKRLELDGKIKRVTKDSGYAASTTSPASGRGRSPRSTGPGSRSRCVP